MEGNQFSRREVQRAFRDFNDKVSDVERCDWTIYKENLHHLMFHLENNPVMRVIIHPLKSYNYEEWEKSLKSGKRSSIFPEDEDERTALFYQLLLEGDTTEDFVSFVFNFVCNVLKRPTYNHASEWVSFFSSEVFAKFVRTVGYRLNEIEDDIEGQEAVQKDALIVFNLHNNGLFIAGDVSAKDSNLEIIQKRAE